MLKPKYQFNYFEFYSKIKKISSAWALIILLMLYQQKLCQILISIITIKYNLKHY